MSGRPDQQVVVERLLSISGEDAITIDRKYRDPVTLQLPTRIMLLSNELPRLADASGALASRFVVLVLRESWLGREDVELFDRLRPERSGILNWAIPGWQRIHETRRFVQPDSASTAIGELEDLASPIGAFLRDRCCVGDEFQVTTDALYDEWVRWSQNQGRKHAGDVQTFGRDLHAALPRLSVTQPRDGKGGRIRLYEGIGLKYDPARDGTRS